MIHSSSRNCNKQIGRQTITKWAMEGENVPVYRVHLS